MNHNFGTSIDMNKPLVSTAVFRLVRIFPVFAAFLCFSQGVYAQFAPSALPFPSALNLMGTYFDTQDSPPEENPFERSYTLSSASEITDGQSIGTYSYTRTGANAGSLIISVSALDGVGNSEESQITYILAFSSSRDGTCTFSGVDEEDGPYSERVYNGNGTFSINAAPLTLQEWRQRNFMMTTDSGNAANNFDFDQDGIPNLVEYALGTSPINSSDSNHPAPSITTIGGQRYLTLTIHRPGGTSGISYVVEVSSMLTGGWMSGAGSTITVTDNDTTLTVRDSIPLGSGQPLRFIRLVVAEL